MRLQTLYLFLCCPFVAMACAGSQDATEPPSEAPSETEAAEPEAEADHAEDLTPTITVRPAPSGPSENSVLTPEVKMTLCRSQTPDLEITALPTSFGVRKWGRLMGTIQVDEAAHMHFESQPSGAGDDQRQLTRIIDSLESEGSILLNYMVRAESGERVYCARQTARSERWFTGALRRHLTDMEYTLVSE